MTAVDLIAQTLGAHQFISTDEWTAGCTCGTGGIVTYLSEARPWHQQHAAQAVTEALGLAQILADQDMLRRIIRALPGPLEMARLRQERP